MPLLIIRLGDPTSQGGSVITASATHSLCGISIARKGDYVSCPVAGHGVNPIIEGATAFKIGGREVALEGHHTACGCTLIATMLSATYS
jgi:uncharacterized Zn-binding protein involved in type VI secretion